MRVVTNGGENTADALRQEGLNDPLWNHCSKLNMRCQPRLISKTCTVVNCAVMAVTAYHVNSDLDLGEKKHTWIC